MSDPVNYEILLAKYIEHVGDEEGTTFVSRLCKNAAGVYEGCSNKIYFTEDEVRALRDCENYYL